VPGLLSHGRGRTFAIILHTLSQLGYGLEWQILDSQDFGVPQARRRVYLAGYLDPKCAGKIFPLQKSDETSVISSGGRCSVESDPDTANPGVQIRSKDSFQWAYPGDCISLAYAGTKNRSARIKRQLAYTIDTQPNKGVVTEAGRIRKLTPRECFRLQGFDDIQIDKILAITSDSQAYKQAGNAVTVNVVAAVGQRFLEADNAPKKKGLSL